MMGGHKGNNSKLVPTVRSAASYNGKVYDVTREGLAEILTAQQGDRVNGDANNGELKSEHKRGNAQQSVFYNPIQQYNRDLSVLAIRAFTEDLAAVRLARQEQRELHPEKAQKRGKKRKRGRGDESMKKESEEGGISVLDAEVIKSRKLDSDEKKTEDLHRDIGTREEGTGIDVEKPKDSTEEEVNELSRDESAVSKSELPAESKNGEKDSLGSDVGSLEPPNGLKISKPISNQPVRILDALSATGLRALRYAKEIPLATSLVANDLSSSATAAIKVNIAHNDLASKITATTSDAIEQMHSTMLKANGRMPQPFHVIDIDPYGTAAPFLDAAVHAVTDGGLLCITCTDAGVFASVGYPEKTYAQYGGLPLKGSHAHEAGLRLILHALATTAARHGIAIEPLLSLSIDFYARVFVRVHKSPVEVKFLASKTMVVYQCDSGCGSWSTQYLAKAKGKEARNGEIVYSFTSALGPSAGTECEHCGFKTRLAGPMWGGALHNPYFVQRILDMLPDLDKEVYQTIPRIEGMLSLALEESLDDPWASTVEPKKQHPSSKTPTEEPPPSATENPTITTSTTSTPTPIPPTNPPYRPIPRLPPHYRTTHPFFIHPPSLARALNTVTPSDASFRGALHHLNYLTSRSHTKPGSIITNAPFTVIWEIMREWARRESKGGQGPKTFAPNTAGAGIMRKDRERRRGFNAARAEIEGKIKGVDGMEGLKRELEAALWRLNNNNSDEDAKDSTTTTTNSTTKTDPPLHKLDIRFDETLGRDPMPDAGRKKRLLRYQTNPRENWGPLARAKG